MSFQVKIELTTLKDSRFFFHYNSKIFTLQSKNINESF